MALFFIILTICVSLTSCDGTEKKSHSKTEERLEEIDLLEPDLDTLPNGVRLLDNIDSEMTHYYKEVVGSDTLIGGYITCYGIDDSTKYFYLRHGNTLHLLNQTPINTSTWGLGLLEKDFDTFFMTQIDNGNSVPSSYQLFDKETGINILGENISAMSYEYLQDTLFMLYENPGEDTQKASITLFNVNTKRKETYELPDNLPDFWSLQIETLSRKILKVTFMAYVGEDFKMTKTYRRPY